ncbi:MFS transporter [Nonomuraea typhae]|uniref:MFS transporter n=1 Tax=Nonomuraea typhae TaxID=2603600 RepID=UPI0012FB69FB|nr:MFS transporter [Nonomuraea typhae]
MSDRQVVFAQVGLGFTINSLGACLVLLARDLATPAAGLAWLSSSFGAGLLAAGLAGRWVLRRHPQPVLRLAALVTAAGTALLATAPVAALAAAGAILLGLGAAGVVLVTPALLRGQDLAPRLARVNAAGSVAALLGPLTMGALDTAGVNGRLALLAAVVPLVLVAVEVRPGARMTGADGALPRRAAAVAWSAIVVAVSMEFCFSIWATARLQVSGLSAGTAAAAATAFLAGMAGARLLAPRLLRRGVPIVPLSCGLVAAGTLIVALAGTPAPIAAGLLAAGLGIGPLYPVTLARLVQVPGLTGARSAAYGALASGTAILAAPAGLAMLGAALDLRTAFLITVMPLALLLLLLARAQLGASAVRPR